MTIKVGDWVNTPKGQGEVIFTSVYSAGPYVDVRLDSGGMQKFRADETTPVMVWKGLHPDATEEHLGVIHEFVRADDPRPAREQFNENYAHGGGWRPHNGFKVIGDGEAIQYPGDPVFPAIAMTMLRDEKIILYAMSYVAIFQPDGTVEIAHMD